MLKDRRELIEHDLKIAKEQASKMYLKIVVSGSPSLDPDYQKLRNQITDLQFDLNIVNELIAKGND